MIKDDLFKASSLTFLGIVTVNIFTYLFQVTMGRMLSVQTFGELNALLSLMLIFGVPFSSITNFIAKNISSYDALGKNREANDLIIKSYWNLLIWGLVITILGAIFSKYMRDYLKIEDIIPILLFLLSIFVSIIIPINFGVLQGLQMFKTFSFVFAGSNILRYIICVALVAIGMGLSGIMIGIILSVLVAGYISFIPIKRHLASGRDPIIKDKDNSFSFIIPAFVANLSFAVFTQLDIILVKYFFTPYDAGIYSSAAVIGKTVMYLPGAIVVPLFSMVASNKAKGEITLHLILKALFLTVLLSGGSALIFYLFPEPIVSIFFGKRFISAVPIIGLFAIAMLPMAIMMIIMNYNLAKGGRYFAYVMLLCAAIQTAGIISFHDSLSIILKVMLYSGFFCAIALFLLMAFEYYKGRLHNLASSLTSNK